MSDTMQLQRFYTVAECAELLRISYRHCHRYITEGRLSALKSGKRTLIPSASLQALLDDMTPAIRGVSLPGAPQVQRAAVKVATRKRPVPVPAKIKRTSSKRG